MPSDFDLPTASFQASPRRDSAAIAMPTRIGRYQIIRELGHGGFGIVYLARDEQLLRQVAVKVPYERLTKEEWSRDDWLAEARIVASLDHPHIVPVYDVGANPECPAYIVSKLIDGSSLSEAVAKQRLPIGESVRIVIAMAEALHYAHTRGLVHRDVKPGNIMLDKEGHAYLNDFGLALREEQYGTEDDRLLGTLQYMSPEQARGEGHLVDGRADIFSLGVVLYELLTGTRPFHGRTYSDILRAVTSHDPRPLRQRNEHIPRELDRICVHAMAKRASERYSTAQDFADDLKAFLAGAESRLSVQQTPTLRSEEPPSSKLHPDSRSALSGTTLLTVVPKGLRAFDESDSDFFLGLLPGPHDRDRLPQNLRFWKSRIEEQSPANPLRIGVVYGPSGCGKSSLVRAGLLPRLSSSVHSLTVTATTQSTEARLLDELRPFLNRPATGLVEAMQQLRRGRSIDHKVLIVIDQFEQWLHANPNSADSELVQALRQCDGEHVACLLIVRDDFWMSVHRFFRELDVRLAERENCAAVDLFDTRHARRVLHAFGHAYEALPERSDDLSPEQREFLDRVIVELAEDDRVICVRLALFAQMVRSRPWIPETLTAIGGARGVGIRFLEDTFGATSAPLSYRVHQVAIREILRALLPAPGTDIKACTQTADELAAAARCAVGSEEFRQLLSILEEETRLLTPVDASNVAVTAPRDEPSASPTVKPDELAVVGSVRLVTQSGDGDGPANSRAYQLTHDYLVPSIREWLTRKQRETWRGRSELRLAERAGLWSSRPERKQLPSLWETLQISIGTTSSNWTPSQANMMAQAQRWHGRRLLMIGLLLLCMTLGAVVWQREYRLSQRQRMADALGDQLLVAEIDRVIPVLHDMAATRELWTARMRALAEQSDAAVSDRLRAELALVTHEPQRTAEILKLCREVDPATLHVAREWLAKSARPTASALWELANLPDQSGAARLRLAALLAEFDLQANESWPPLATSVAATLVHDADVDAIAWAELLMPIHERLSPALAVEFLKNAATSTPRLNAAQLLSRLGSTEVLCRLLPEADVAQFSWLLRPLMKDRESAAAFLRPLLAEKPPATSIEDRLKLVARQRTAAVAITLLGHEELVWPLLSGSADPSLRTELMLTMRSFGVSLETLLRGEETVPDPVIRQAIWQSLVGTGIELSATEKDEVSRRIQSRWPQVTHQAERAGIAWLARTSGLSELLNDKTSRTPPAGSDWSVNSQGQEFLEIRGPVEFLMGSPDNEPRRDGNERQHRRRIDRSFAVGVYEVTAEQFRRYQPSYAPDPNVCVTSECPASFMSWFDGAKYCRWLSEQEGVPDHQMCYPPSDQIHADLVLPSDHLSRTGYRLPTEAEWEFVCRGGTATRYFCGEDERHLSEFGWWLANSAERTWPVGLRRPNPIGLFDLEGNVHEWCQDVFAEYPHPVQPTAAVADDLSLISGPGRVFRGATYRNAGRSLRTAFRYQLSPATNASILGFRLIRTVATK